MAVLIGRLLVELLGIVFHKSGIRVPHQIAACTVQKDGIVILSKPPAHQALGDRSLPDYLVPELVLSEDLVKHDLDVVARVPVAMVVEGAGFLEDACELEAAGPHEFDVGLGGGVSVLEGPAFAGLAPEDFVVAVGIEGGIDVDEVDAGVGKLAEVVEVVAAIDDAGVDDGRWLGGRGCHDGLRARVRSAGEDDVSAG